MALDLLGAATVGGLDLGRGNDVQLVMMTGEITGVGAAALTGVLVNEGSGLAADSTSITVDTVDATTKMAVGDRLFRANASDGTEFEEIGTLTSVGATALGVSAGTAVALTNNDELFVAAEYDISADGVVTVGGGSTAGAAAADLVLSQGAGQIVVKGVDLAQVAGTNAKINRGGIALTLECTFGKTPSTTDSLNLIGAVGSFGWDVGSGTVGSATIDGVSFGSVAAISGNKVEFHVGLPYENEGGTQLNIADGSILKFCILGIAKSDGV